MPLKIKCTNCETIFESDENIPLLFEFDGGVVCAEHEQKPNIKFIEAFHGCEKCKTDDYLMDLQPESGGMYDLPDNDPRQEFHD